MSDEKVNVSLEELQDKPVDGRAECSLKTEGIEITVKGKQEMVCRAIEVLFQEFGVEFLGSMTEDEMRELLAKMDGVAASVKDGTMYHLNISPP